MESIIPFNFGKLDLPRQSKTKMANDFFLFYSTSLCILISIGHLYKSYMISTVVVERERERQRETETGRGVGQK